MAHIFLTTNLHSRCSDSKSEHIVEIGLAIYVFVLEHCLIIGPGNKKLSNPPMKSKSSVKIDSVPSLHLEGINRNCYVAKI